MGIGTCAIRNDAVRNAARGARAQGKIALVGAGEATARPVPEADEAGYLLGRFSPAGEAVSVVLVRTSIGKALDQVGDAHEVLKCGTGHGGSGKPARVHARHERSDA